MLVLKKLTYQIPNWHWPPFRQRFWKDNGHEIMPEDIVVDFGIVAIFVGIIVVKSSSWLNISSILLLQNGP